MNLEEITSGASLEGVEPATVVTVVAAIPIPPNALQLIYRGAVGCAFTALQRRLASSDGAEGPFHLRNPFEREPCCEVSSVNDDLGALLARAEPS